ncbi:MAG: division/cell wall cluster transcriptional repressor MraZ [Bacteroidetes bacterium]|nr:division/cell wall cluster transcriptional repressor MraZ [Bacteroidota bacterium]
MANVLGEFEVTVDAKGRFMIPTGFKKQLTEAEGAKFVLNRSFEKCLTLYTMEQWKKVESVVMKLNDFNKKARMFKRAFLNGATFLEPDAAGRLLIPKKMLEYAGITKDMMFNALIDKVELWDADSHNEETAGYNEDMDSIESEGLGGEFMNPFDGI